MFREVFPYGHKMQDWLLFVVCGHTQQNKIIAIKGTYIIKEDGGITMAQFSNLPSRLFHVLFGQPPKEWRKGRTGERKDLITQDDTKSTVSKNCHFCKFQVSYGCHLKIKELLLIFSPQ